MEKKSSGIKINWFINDIYYKTFISYKEACDFFSEKINDNVTNYDINNILNKNFDKLSKFKKIQIYNKNEDIPFKTFQNNSEFVNFFEIQKPNISTILNNILLNEYTIKVINNIPDIRLSDNIKEEIVKKEIVKKVKKISLNNKPENLNQDWKPHPEFTNYYFERDTTRIYNIETSKYIIANPVINNKERLICNLKWEAFYGKISENKIVRFKNGLVRVKDPDHSELDNLECVYVHCNTCEKLIENPKSMDQIFCSKSCQRKTIHKRHKIDRNSDLIKYTRHKLYIHRNINKKYNTIVDYDLEYLTNMGTICYYCGVNCKFGNEKDNNHPDTLTFDKKNPDIGYVKENIVVCCWFCNRMKNQTVFEDWEKFIKFIKNENEVILDLSDKQFAKRSSDINLSNIYFHIKEKCPYYYPTLNESKETFKQICKKQNYLDPFFNFFPVINLGINCLFNVSIDAIDATLPKSESHRPDNIQVLPKCFNYGKNTLSNEEFVNEWKLRNFKTNFENCVIKLPEEYYTESYLEKFLK
jgi:hypothetical protein